jgi:SAM-dependent methyltransferase
MTATVAKLKTALKKRPGLFTPNERLFLFQHLSEFASGLKDELVLDVGAGMRQYQGLFARERYQSCDMEEGFHADQRHDFLANIYDIPQPDQTYDVVLMLQVLEHLEFPLDGLNEVNRILKPGGRLFLSVPQAAGDHFEPHHYFNYTQYGLNSVLRQTGFVVESHYRLAGMFAYVGNRIEKLGSLMVQQSKRRNILVRIAAHLFSVVCKIMAWVVSRFNFLDQEKRYCIGHIVIARKDQHVSATKRTR